MNGANTVVVEQPSEKDKINVLLLSDIHMAHQNIDLLKQWHQSRNKNVNYDYVFVSGDIGVAPNESYDINHEAEKIAEQEVNEVLLKLGIFGNQLIWIPGNHDPTTMYKPDRQDKVENNIHMRATKLRDDLVVIGVGGSVPDFV